MAESDAEIRSLLANGWGAALVSPLTNSCRSRSGFVVKELRSGSVRRHVLLSDPTVVSRNLHDALHTRLSRLYLERALERNPSYLDSARFPRLGQGQSPCQHADPRILAGLSVAPRSLDDGDAEPMLEPEDLHMLRVVADCGSLNRAAPLLLITQPALTRRISRLERRLGMQLLLRGHRGTVLTAAAHRLLEGVAEAEAFFQTVSAAVREQAHDAGGRARLWPVPVGSPRPQPVGPEVFGLPVPC